MRSLYPGLAGQSGGAAHLERSILLSKAACGAGLAARPLCLLGIVDFRLMYKY